ncbi:cyclic AMP-responsive element-binding protein 3 isoform X1 [Grus americana]|uniref:cyclic AMP-responsive element-binding protein 3 isoform X1 n=1 Tax=Grus americana TaxID=9117 RepID=UPI002407940D|nr:cyclic AMP-responsive element-binding protein 3 isoform X1 [Grus americana]
MLCPEEPDVLIDKDLLDFLLKDDAPCPEILEKENGLLEDWSTPEPELLVKEMDEFISFMLKRFEDKPGMLQGYLPTDSDNGICMNQFLSYSPGIDFAGSLWSPDVVQVDHNYSLHQDFPVLESVKSEIAGGNVSTDLGTWMGLEGTSKAMELSSGFPIAVAVEAEPQLVPGAIMQTEERLLKKVRRKIRNKPSALGNRRRKKIYVDGLKHRVAAYTTQNRELEKKVQLLQKRNMSLLKQLRKLQALVRQSTAKTTTAKTCTMAMVLSFCLVVSPSICLFESQEQQMKLRVLSQQIGKFPNQAVCDVQENAALEGFTLEPEDTSLSDSLIESQEEGHSPSNPDPGPSFNGNSCSDPPVAAACFELCPAQFQEQYFQVNPLQTAVLLEWDAKRQEWVEHTATVVVQHDCADEM